MKKFHWIWKTTIHFLTPTLGWSNALAALTSGLLLVLVFPPWNITPLLAAAPVPLLLYLRPGENRINAELGLLTGFVYYLGLLHWLHHVTTGGMLALVLYLSIIFSLQCVLIGWAKRYPLWILSTAAVWAGIEYLRSLGPLSFAWGYLGHGVYPLESMKPVTALIGMPGLSFLIAGFNASLAAEAQRFVPYLRKNISGSNSGKPVFTHVFLTVFFLLILVCHFHGRSTIHGFRANHDAAEFCKVALIQGAFEQERKETAPEEEILDVYLGLSQNAMQENPDLIVWPESTITMPLEFWAEGIDRIQKFADREDVEMLIGTVRGQFTTERKFRFWNSAVLFSPGRTFDFENDPVDLSSVPSYSKTHLVPFGEWIPLGKYWPFYYIETLIEEAGAGIFQPGNQLTIFETRKGVKFAVTICFESTLPRLWNRAKNQGADFIINITNDAWYRRSAGLEQHFSQCSFRAAENGLHAVRAANTGITGIIGPAGETMASLLPHEPAFGVYSIPVYE